MVYLATGQFGFSSNTIVPESGNTISSGTYTLSVSTLSGILLGTVTGAVSTNTVTAQSGNTISTGTYAISASTVTTPAAIMDKTFVRIGANKSFGTALLSVGSIKVSTSAITTNSIVMLASQGGGTLANLGALELNGITSGVSFGINSTSATDNNVVAWWIVNPAP